MSIYQKRYKKEKPNDLWNEKMLPNNITLNKTSMVLNVGETQQLTVNITPDNASDKSVILTSNDTNIVTVS